MNKTQQQCGPCQHRRRFVLSLFVFCSTLFSCVKPQVFEEVSERGGVATREAQAISCSQYPSPFALDLPADPKSIEIHVDASGSMAGYTHNSRSRYNQTLELLEQISNSSQSTVPSYFRAGFNKSSGRGSQEISRSQFRKAKKIEFYDGTTNPTVFPGVTSNLQSAIFPDPGDRPEGFDLDQRLLVLVTDLSPDDGDTIGLTEEFKKIWTGSSREVTEDDTNEASHMAVAVIGVRSEFQGYLQSPNEERYSFSSKDYSTNGLKPEQYRPFYLVVVGHVQYVQGFLSNLVSRTASVGDSTFSLENTTIFYPSLIAPLNVDNVQFQKISGLADWGLYTLRNDNVFVEFSDPSLYKVFRIPSNEDGPLEFSYSLSFDTHVGKGIDLSTKWITPKTFKVIQETKLYNPTLQDFTVTESPLGLEPDPIEVLEGQAATLSISLEPQVLSSSSIYVNSLHLEALDYQEPTWWDAWDFDQALQDLSSQPEADILSTTPGFKQFSQNLASFTVSMMHTGALCHAFQHD